jgi:hypothetical protein
MIIFIISRKSRCIWTVINRGQKRRKKKALMEHHTEAVEVWEARFCCSTADTLHSSFCSE